MVKYKSMTIRKIGHSCLFIKENSLGILTDPGSFTVAGVKDLKGIDLVLIADEHSDHLDMDSVKIILKNNPGAKILTQRSVQKILAKADVPSWLLLDGERQEIKGVAFEGCGEKHALIHSSVPQSDNTGFLIADRFFYPGDALTLPKKPVEILALPIAGPWLKIGEAIDYALAVKPKFCFPVHDGFPGMEFLGQMASRLITAQGIQFVVPQGEMSF